ncbi:MAG: hypothetical protein PHG05_00355 [Candidatus Nanoarchaeia archaeon]|nr:hypothetical protein [Candidatus Nanoarchaeia archaeon]
MNNYSIEEILGSVLVKNIKNKLFDSKEIEIIQRPASLIIRLKNEPEDRIFRIIILPPNGFTGNIAGETNPHPEARKAKIEIKGGIRPNKSGFNLLKNCIKYQYYQNRDIKVIGEEPYPNLNEESYKEEIKSSRQKFFVVKENGIGFYHSLVNLSDEWVLLILDKELRLQKLPDLQSKIKDLNEKYQKIISSLHDKIVLYGDAIFDKEPELVKKICNLDADRVIPSLVEMLNLLETGKHEPCTVYALILKIGKDDTKVVNSLREALKNKTAPKYYLEELLKKLS